MRQNLQNTLDTLNSIVLGKPREIKLALTAVLGGGHLLIEDLPGMGKTTLAQAMSKVLGLSHQRIQFTSDVLPSDVLGVTVFSQIDGEFSFHQGPIFCNLLLADEINRTTPKSQSALLEAMEEGSVTTEGVTRELPDPFFVIATQNPNHQTGTYPLPESQLDRFLLRVQLGYPDSASERILLESGNRRNLIASCDAVLDGEKVKALQHEVSLLRVSEELLDYLQRLAEFTRQSEALRYGLSPRGVMAVLSAAKAWAYIAGRDYVIPEDIQAIFSSATDHRLRDQSGKTMSTHLSIGEWIVTQVDVIN
ncbi:MAG TPA: AAA family ATPase [Gammaproteobacteria bacterium]|nr:AAA family ATPase [Gammaproteobacteria bacterium]HIK69266.1 AAA family ATPase [Pseudomonadales bacterium]